MGKRGPRPIPTALVTLHGNPRQRGKATSMAAAASEPEGVGDLWAPPAFFNDDLRDVWAYALAHCPPGLLTGTDREVLALWCGHVVAWRNACARVALDGLFVVRGGVEMEHPAVRIMNRQAQLIMRCCGELGFSPASRVGLIKTGAGPEFYQHDQPPAARPRNPRLIAYLAAKPDKLDS